MKDQILKIAKVKSEKEFYKKYPTEAAFMKAHGKAFQKAAMGKSMVAKQLTQLTDFANPPQAQIGAYIGGEQDVNDGIAFADIYNNLDYQTTGMTNQMRDRRASVEAQQQMAANSANGGGNKDIENIGKIANVAMMAMNKGGNVRKLQTGPGVSSNLWGPNPPLMGGGPTGAPGSPANPGAGMYPIQPGGNPSNPSIQQGFGYNPGGGLGLGYGPGGGGGNDLLDTIASYAPGAGQLVNNFQQIKGAIKAREKSNQFVDVSRVTKEAAGTRGEISKRRYYEPKDMRFDPNQMNKPRGEGTNYLAEDGAMIGGNPLAMQYGGSMIPTSKEAYDAFSKEYNEFYTSRVPYLKDDGFDDFYKYKTKDLKQVPRSQGSGWLVKNDDSEIFEPSEKGEPMPKKLQKKKGTKTFVEDYIKMEENPMKEYYNSLLLNLVRKNAKNKYSMLPSYQTLQDGGGIGGNPTEIQNTYAPNSIYTNLEYTPLRDTNIKQFQNGGFADTFNNPIMAGVNIASDLTTAIINSGTRKRNQQGFQNLGASALQQGAQQIQNQNSGFMEDGGWVSNDWQPQVIASFGEHKMKDLLKPPYDADMLRAGGHIAQVGYTAPSERAMSTERPNFQMGGELQTHWGGYTEPVAENPYLPDGGITYMPRGNYHSQSDGKGNTGIGITFGDNPVEVERGEPMVKLQDGGTGENNLVVLGALDIPDYALTDINKAAKGKKFKTYGTELTKNTTKQNKMVEKATEKINDLEVLTPFDNLEMNSLQAQILGGNMKLKDIAIETEKLGRLQQAIHDSANEFGYSDVAKFNKDVKANRVKIGNSQPDDVQSAQTGISLPKLEQKDYERLKNLYNIAKKQGRGPAVKKFQQEFHKLAKPYAEKILSEEPPTAYGKERGYAASDTRGNEDEIFGTRTEKYMSALKDVMEKKRTPYVEDIPEYTPLNPVTVTSTKKKQPIIEEEEIPTEYDWQDIYNAVLPYVRPSNQLELDPTQLAGEMYALANNQVDPVFAQSYKPMLSTPFDISLQDQLNANQADYNATQRLVGYNPAALSQLNAQKYAANSAVLGQQTRLNQAEKARVYESNRNILNDAQLKNIEIYDQQMFRQSKALSNTKAQTQEALNSISDKYSKNRLENITAGIYENLYNYRYDNRGRAINMNPLIDFQEMIDNASPADLAAMKADLDKRTAKAKGKTARNGNVVKAIKNL